MLSIIHHLLRYQLSTEVPLPSKVLTTGYQPSIHGISRNGMQAATHSMTDRILLFFVDSRLPLHIFFFKGEAAFQRRLRIWLGGRTEDTSRFSKGSILPLGSNVAISVSPTSAWNNGSVARLWDIPGPGQYLTRFDKLPFPIVWNGAIRNRYLVA